MHEKVAKHNKAALAAAKRYANTKPWRGTFAERVDKIRAVHEELLDAYDIDIDLIIDTEGGAKVKANGFVTYDSPQGIAIVLRPGFAVMTYFRLFAEVLEYNRDLKFTKDDECVSEYVARWANGLFSKAFPKSWAKLVERNAPILTRDYA